MLLMPFNRMIILEFLLFGTFPFSLSMMLMEDIESNISFPQIESISLNEMNQDKELFDQFFLKENSLLLKMENNDNYDNDRFLEIKETLLDFPIEIVKIISFYDYKDKSPLAELYKKVTSALLLSKDEEESLIFHNESFANQLYKLLISSLKKIKIPFGNCFWYDLERLAFKWMIYMKQETINDKIKFQIASNEINPIVKMIRKNSGASFASDFNPMSPSENTFSFIFKNLITFEFYENFQSIIPIFSSILCEFYGNGNGGVMEEIDSEMIKIKYFKGNFDVNILLKYMIIIFDPIGRLRLTCFPEIRSIFPPIEFPITKITKEYLLNLNFNGPREFGHVYNLKYLSASIIKFFLRTGKKFQITEHENLLILLYKLKEMNFLRKEILKEIIEFRFYAIKESFGWNEKRFEELIIKASESDNIEMDCLEFLKLIKTF